MVDLEGGIGAGTFKEEITDWERGDLIFQRVVARANN